MIFERSNTKKAVLLYRALKIISPFPVLIAALLNKLYEPSQLLNNAVGISFT